MQRWLIGSASEEADVAVGDLDEYVDLWTFHESRRNFRNQLARAVPPITVTDDNIVILLTTLSKQRLCSFSHTLLQPNFGESASNCSTTKRRYASPMLRQKFIL